MQRSITADAAGVTPYTSTVVEHGATTAATESGTRQLEEAPSVDPVAVERAYRLHRARRLARLERRRATKRAGVRFWLVLLLLVGASGALVLFVAQEIERLFGI
jgi:urease accessory protein UreF